jgi:GntR family transcriptional regulator
MFSLNPQSGIPIYRQLMEQITRMISSGQLRAGDSLPSVRELAQTHAVNAMTISKAYSMLEAQGLLARQRGKAMTISTQANLSEAKSDRIKRLQPTIKQLVMAAEQLELSSDDVIDALLQEINIKNGDSQ